MSLAIPRPVFGVRLPVLSGEGHIFRADSLHMLEWCAGKIAIPMRATRAAPVAQLLVLAQLILTATLCFAGSLPVFTTAKQVRALPPEQAKRGLAVRVRGQVLVLSGWKNSFFFSDGRVGISVDRNDILPELHSGDEVEVVGKTSAGLFAPLIVADQVRVLGAGKLPPAPLHDYRELADGTQDSQWVRVQGVVQTARISQSWGRSVLFLDIDMGGARVTARIRDFAESDPSSLVDAEVSVRGVCGTNFNAARQFVGLRLFVADMKSVAIEKLAVFDPFSQPPAPLDGLQRFSLSRKPRHRVRVLGTVTYQKLGEALYVQAKDKGLYVETAQATAVALGTKIDVLGFVAAGSYTPGLSAGIFRVVGPGEKQTPVAVPVQDVIATNSDGFLASIYDGRLVRLRGKLADRITGPNEDVLEMSASDLSFAALLAKPAGSEVLTDLRLGSELDLTGVITIQSDQSREPRGFVLRLRTPGDVAVIHAATWWDRKHREYAFILVTLTALGSLVGVVFLRRKVKQQVDVVRESLAANELTLKALADQKFALDQHAIVAITDVQGTITYVNDKFCVISQYCKEELIGQNHRILNSGHHSQEFFQQLYRTIAQGNVWHDEICNRAKDGSFYWVDTTVVPFVGSDGKPRQYVAIRADITERKRAEQQLAGKADELSSKAEELARSNRELEQFAYVASHDLQEPLRMVASYTQLFAERYRGHIDETADKFIGYASEGALRMQVLIHDLLAFSRVGRPGVVCERVNCNSVLEGVLQSLTGAIRESGAIVTYDSLPDVWADRPQIAQVFQNLIGNAIKFRKEASPEIRVRAVAEGNRWLFSVGDNGIGIAPEYAENIFVVFQRLHARSEYAGNGIGLSICKKIVEYYGGRIWVEAQPGSGSTFKFTLPSVASQADARHHELIGAQS